MNPWLWKACQFPSSQHLILSIGNQLWKAGTRWGWRTRGIDDVNENVSHSVGGERYYILINDCKDKHFLSVELCRQWISLRRGMCIKKVNNAIADFMLFSLFRSSLFWILLPKFWAHAVRSPLAGSQICNSHCSRCSACWCTWPEWLWSLLGSAGRMSMPL